MRCKKNARNYENARAYLAEGEGALQEGRKGATGTRVR